MRIYSNLYLKVRNEVVSASTQTEFEESCKSTLLEAESSDTKYKNSQASDVVLRKTTSLKRRNSRCASGDWSQIRKVHSGLFEDEWNFDAINANEQLKITQDLLVQANEIIMIMTEENEKVSIFTLIPLSVSWFLSCNGPDLRLWFANCILAMRVFFRMKCQFLKSFDTPGGLQHIDIQGRGSVLYFWVKCLPKGIFLG